MDAPNQAPANAWTFGWFADQSYHPVFLGSPQLVPQTEGEAKTWAEGIAKLLTQKRPELDKRSPLDPPNTGGKNNHLTVLMTTEFFFNGYKDEGVNKYDASHPVKWAIFETAMNELHSVISQSEFKDHPIVLSMSSVVEYPQQKDAQGATWAENATFVMNNKSTQKQKISKYARSSIDNWDLSRFTDISSKDLKLEKVDSDERREEHLYSLNDLGIDNALGFGICLDSMNERYPGTALVLFSSGGMHRDLVRDTDRIGYLLCDVENFIKADPNEKADPGFRYFRNLPRIGENRGFDTALKGFQKRLTLDVQKSNTSLSMAEVNAEVEERMAPWRAIPKDDADVYKLYQAADMAWVPAIKESANYYRAGDYTTVQSEEVQGLFVVHGKFQKLPSESKQWWKLRGRNLSIQEMNQFQDKDEFLEVCDVAHKEAVAQLNGNGNVQDADNLSDLLRLYNDAKDRDKLNGGSWEGLKWGEDQNARIVSEQNLAQVQTIEAYVEPVQELGLQESGDGDQGAEQGNTDGGSKGLGGGIHGGEPPKPGEGGEGGEGGL